MTANSLPPVETAALEPELAARVGYAFARRHGVLPARRLGPGIEVWVRPGGVRTLVLAELQRVFGDRLVLKPCPDGDFDSALQQAFASGGHDTRAIVGGLDEGLDLDRLSHELPRVADLLESENDAPVVRLINALFSQAAREGASDIHFEPYETRSVVRLRVDGMLRDVLEVPLAAHGFLVSRIKILAELDIAEKRLPQDGRILLRLAGRPIDVRVSTIPTAHGERVVLRLLDKQAGRLSLAALGMAPPTLAALDALIHQPHGILLVTGPTGSGKTTTLYAALAQLDTRQLNIMTVEDPIEYDLEGIAQTQINPKIDLDFARALRAILRQDPDVIMIGEIRDLETAQIAVQASLTGHLVLATLHTNDAIGAVTRLVDMGIEPFLVASSLLGVLAQRLVRKLCPDCRRPHRPDAAEQRLLHLACADDPMPTMLYTAVGCPACDRTGYRGRTGIFELLTVDDSLRALIHDRAGEARLREHARRRGMVGLREDGLRWVRAGVTSLEEVLRVTRD
jgi:general secretion pathway protein E